MMLSWMLEREGTEDDEGEGGDGQERVDAPGNHGSGPRHLGHQKRENEALSELSSPLRCLLIQPCEELRCDACTKGRTRAFERTSDDKQMELWNCICPVSLC